MFLPLAHWSPRRLELWETSHPAHIVGHRKSHPSPRRRAGFAPDARDGGNESPSPGKEGRIGNEMKDEWKRGECRPLGGGVMDGVSPDQSAAPARACSERGIRLSHSTGTSMRNRHVYLGTRWHVRVDVEDQLFEARRREREKHTQIAGRLNGEGDLEPVQRRPGGGQASVQTIRVQSQHEYERAERGRRVHGGREGRAVREDKWLDGDRGEENTSDCEDMSVERMAAMFPTTSPQLEARVSTSSGGIIPECLHRSRPPEFADDYAETMTQEFKRELSKNRH
ncbi:hypothetical protein B0H11DRAFT_2201769 [Mycena galericulata]|nr:hypothetical protein B0H11DRAFT_2201769 [Mycena galericulata]